MDQHELDGEVESSDPVVEAPTDELKPKKKKKERADDDVKPLRGEQKKKFVEWIGRHADNLYPSREEKLGLAKQLNASYIQVTRLLANHRRRLQVQKKRRSSDEAANSSDKENQRAGGSEPPDDRLGHLNSVIDECSRLPPADDERRLDASGRDDHEPASNQFHCDERLDEADEQKGGREASARRLRIDAAIEATRERVRRLPADFDLDELLAVGAGAEMDGNYVTPPPSVHPPALATENPNGNPQISPAAAPPAAAPSIPQSTPKSVDPAAPMGVDATQHATAAYHQHLLNLNTILQQQQQQLGEQRSASGATQQTPVHVHPIPQSFCKPPTAEGESRAPAIDQQPPAPSANTRPQLALNQLIGNQSTAASVPEIAPAAPLQTTADSTVAAASASTSAASTSSASASSMLFPQAFNGMQGVPVHSPQWMAAFQLLQQHQAAAVAAQQHAGGAPPNEQQMMNEMHQALALRAQQQQLGGPTFTTALAELQNRQQQLQQAAASGVAKTAASTASTSATPLTPDHVGDGEFGRSLEQKFAAPTAETLNLLNDGRHPNWMSPPLSSHTPASSASPMLFAGEDNAEGRLPSAGGAGGPLGSTLLSVDNEPAFSDISSTCSGSPPPADFAPSDPLPMITSSNVATLLNGDSSVFTTPPTPADSKAEKPPKKRRQSKKAAAAVEVDVEVVDEKPDDAVPPTTPVTSRKRVSVGGAAKPRESAAAKRARLAAGQPDGGVRKAPKKPKAKRATIPSTLIVPRAFHELNENESIAVRVLAGLAHGVYH
ncbi:Homeobox domain-containing protein [Aphelenchoides fujianensis]|nr:Homeobox domain-containing protein [Aphelenchoides fujianensis]